MEPTETHHRAEELDRREALALLAAVGGTALLVPTQWSAPLLEWTALPAHAATSTEPGTGNPGTGNPGTGNPGTGNPGTGSVTGTGFPATVPVGTDNFVTVEIDIPACAFALASGDTGAATAVVIEFQPSDSYAQAIIRGGFNCMSASGWEMTGCFSDQVYGIGYGYPITLMLQDELGNQMEIIFTMEADGETTVHSAEYVQGGCS